MGIEYAKQRSLGSGDVDARGWQGRGSGRSRREGRGSGREVEGEGRGGKQERVM